jgi:hypothetical protein
LSRLFFVAGLARWRSFTILRHKGYKLGSTMQKHRKER